MIKTPPLSLGTFRLEECLVFLLAVDDGAVPFWFVCLVCLVRLGVGDNLFFVPLGAGDDLALLCFVRLGVEDDVAPFCVACLGVDTAFLLLFPKPE